jgi:hypothetical protein
MGIGTSALSFGGGLMSVINHTTEPVPLYLIPKTLSEEIRKYGDAISEVRVRRTAGHNYLIKIKHEVRGGQNE